MAKGQLARTATVVTTAAVVAGVSAVALCLRRLAERKLREGLLGDLKGLERGFIDRGVNVASFNMLLRSFENKDYASYASVRNRSWQHRLGLLKEVLPAMNCDVIAVQEAEIETFREDFAWMADHGFGVVEPFDRDAAKGKAGDLTLAKPAIFYNESLFRLTWKMHRSRITLCSLEHIPTGQVLYVVNCHLEGHPNKVAERFQQLRSAFKSLAARQVAEKQKPEECNVIVCGDFNSEEACAPCTLLETGSMLAEYRDPWAPSVQITPKDYTHPYKLRNTYKKHRSSLPCYTYLGKQGHRVIDFIYASSHLPVAATQHPYTPDQYADAQKTGIPNDWHPSDHFHLAATVVLPDRQA